MSIEKTIAELTASITLLAQAMEFNTAATNQHAARMDKLFNLAAGAAEAAVAPGVQEAVAAAAEAPATEAVAEEATATEPDAPVVVEPTPEPEAPVEAEPELTDEQKHIRLKNKLLELQSLKKKVGLAALFAEFNVAKLSELAATQYDAVYDRAVAILAEG